ncbi:MAG: CRISPR-associated endonuclease Cas1 [Promethearchaeota archaeon]
MKETLRIYSNNFKISKVNDSIKIVIYKKIEDNNNLNSTSTKNNQNIEKKSPNSPNIAEKQNKMPNSSKNNSQININNINQIDSDDNNTTIKETKLIPATRLNSIEIYGNPTITTQLLQLSNQLKIPIYICSYYGHPIGKFLPEKSHSKINTLLQYKNFFNQSKKTHIAKSIVKKAIDERIRIIKKFDKNMLCSKEIDEMRKFQQKIDSIEDCPSLRGIEGNYMKSFFNAFKKLLKYLKFEKRETRPPTDSGNAILSWGNVLLYNTVRSEVFKAGLDSKIGFLHEPHENRDSLAIDIAEIFRPIIVDNLILRLDRKRHLSPNKHFKYENNCCYLNEQGKKIWNQNYKNFLISTIKYPPLNRKISIQEEIKLECYNLIKFFNQEKKQYIPLKFNNP